LFTTQTVTLQLSSKAHTITSTYLIQKDVQFVQHKLHHRNINIAKTLKLKLKLIQLKSKLKVINDLQSDVRPIVIDQRPIINL